MCGSQSQSVHQRRRGIRPARSQSSRAERVPVVRWSIASGALWHMSHYDTLAADSVIFEVQAGKRELGSGFGAMLKRSSRCAGILVCAAGALGLANCGGSTSPRSSAPPSNPPASAPATKPEPANGASPSTPTGTARPTSPTRPVRPRNPEFADLQAYKRRCAEITNRGAWARVLYRPSQEMTRGDSATVTAAVTLNLKAPPARVLQSRGEVATKVVVSCIIAARLSGSSYDFNLSDRGWQPRSFETMDTARWQWSVGPKVGGTQMLVLSLQPVVRIGRASLGYGSYVSTENTNIASYVIRAHVKVPLAQRIPEMMSSLAATFKVAQGLVEGATGLVAAIIAFGAVIGIRRLRQRGRDELESNSGKPLSAK